MNSIKEKGITLVEIIIALFIIATFSLILVSDFPRIKQQYAVTRAAYKMAQDIKRVQDMSLSGVFSLDIPNIKGYGFYASARDHGNDDIRYIIYADRAVSGNNPDQKFDNDSIYGNAYFDCSEQTDPNEDCILEAIYFSKDSPGALIASISYVDSFDNEVGTNWASINFSPPNPNIKLFAEDSSGDGQAREQKIININISSNTRPDIRKTVLVNKAGLIEVK